MKLKTYRGIVEEITFLYHTRHEAKIAVNTVLRCIGHDDTVTMDEFLAFMKWCNEFLNRVYGCKVVEI